MYNKNFYKEVQEMKVLGDILSAYNFPKKSKDFEAEINILKIRNICVDGYDLILHFNKSCYDNFTITSLQIFSKFGIFLPFNIVCKVSREFLGDEHLSLYEEFNNNKNIYCWSSIKDLNLDPIKISNDNIQYCDFEGFKYCKVL